MNREGLTYPEWLEVARAWDGEGVDPLSGRKRRIQGSRKAWQAGEDPTEYAKGV